MLCLNITRSDGSFKHKMSLHRKKLNVIITGRNEVVCDSVNGGGGVLSQHALQVVSQHALQQVWGGGCYPSMHCRWYPSMSCSRSPGGCQLLGGCLVWGMPGLGGAWSGGMPSLGGLPWGGLCGLLLWPSVIVFCFALLLWPSGVAFCYGLLVWCPSDCRRPSG